MGFKLTLRNGNTNTPHLTSVFGFCEIDPKRSMVRKKNWQMRKTTGGMEETSI